MRRKVAILLCCVLLFVTGFQKFLVPPQALASVANKDKEYEVFGFAPWWNIDKLDNVDFDVLTTMAYFGISVNGNGTFDTEDQGYRTYYGDQAKQLFQKAHRHGTRVVLTLTQMDNYLIQTFLDNSDAQNNAIKGAVGMVQDRKLDGINIDFEYSGDPGQHYKDLFTVFVKNLTNTMHGINPNSQVTVSVYASAVKNSQLYDIGEIASISDAIFMMAYDYATTSSDNAIPTAPLYGHKSGKYWYDVSTAVDDFLTVMPANKLILGVPWYGYEYPVMEPSVNALTLWGESTPETYADIQANLTPAKQGASGYMAGWDNQGKVGWKAYYNSWSGTWRMIFIEDTKSLGIKYSFAKNRKLKGVGMWALGMDKGRTEMWSLLSKEFGKNKFS